MDALTERHRPLWGRILRRLALGTLVGLVTAIGLLLVASADARFVARAGLEEARVLLKRRSITKLLADPATPAPLVQRFKLVLAARQFAADSLHLAAGETFTTYVDVGRDTLLLVLSASPRNKLRQFTWTFPIVGVVPYKGFFDARRARTEAAELDRRGYDV